MVGVIGTRKTLVLPLTTLSFLFLQYNFKQNLKSELLVTSEVTDFSSKALWPSFMYTVLFQFYVAVARILFRFGGGGGELKRNTLPQTGCQEWKESYIPGTSLSSYF